MIHEALNDIIFEISLVRFCFYFISCYYLKHILSVAIMTPLVLVWQHKSAICRTAHISRLHLSLADVAIRKHTDTHTHTHTHLQTARCTLGVSVCAGHWVMATISLSTHQSLLKHYLPRRLLRCVCIPCHILDCFLGFIYESHFSYILLQFNIRSFSNLF